MCAWLRVTANGVVYYEIGRRIKRPKWYFKRIFHDIVLLQIFFPRFFSSSKKCWRRLQWQEGANVNVRTQYYCTRPQSSVFPKNILWNPATTSDCRGKGRKGFSKCDIKNGFRTEGFFFTKGVAVSTLDGKKKRKKAKNLTKEAKTYSLPLRGGVSPDALC